jgi:hypothetical protein
LHEVGEDRKEISVLSTKDNLYSQNNIFSPSFLTYERKVKMAFRRREVLEWDDCKSNV